MNFEYFIAKKIISSKKEGGTGLHKAGTRPIIRIAIAGIVLGLTVMIASVAIVTGFQNEIREKVIGFGSHIQINRYDAYNAIETPPVSMNQKFYPGLDSVEGVRHIQVYGTKAGIIKTEDEVQGVVLKGVGQDFDWSFFKKNMVGGEVLNLPDSNRSNDILISKYIADKLQLNVNEKLVMYFIQEPMRVRKFNIVGIFDSGLEKFDQSFVIGDIRHIQKLNDWLPTQVSGFEVILEKYDDLDRLDEIIYEYIGINLNSTKITDKHQDIFGWLDLQDMNVVIIIALMILVAGINMISALLILILERTNMIGVLKSMGANNWSIRKIFLYNAAYLISVGLVWGNVLGISLCLLQQKFGFIKLPKESYYISQVPINLDFTTVLLLNAGTLTLCLVMLIIPTYVITKITPVKAIRFD